MKAACVVAAVALAVMAAGCGSRGSGGALPPSSAAATVNSFLEGTPRPLPPDWLGLNGEAVTGPAGLWSSRRFVRAVAALRPQAIRVFGGTPANFWDWRRGTFVAASAAVATGLPPDLASARSRVSVPLPDWARLVRGAHASPVFDVNLVSSTLAEQLAMLRAARRLGMPVTRVELGNELYLSRYRRLFADGAAYGNVATRWAAALKAAFPGVRVAADGFVARGFGARPSAREQGWNAGVLSTLRGVDALTFHPYFRSGLRSRSSLSSQRAVTALLVAASVRWAQVQSQAFASLRPGMTAWLTEFNLFDRAARVHTTWAQGLALANYTLDALADPRVDQADVHALVASAPFGALFADSSGLVFGAAAGRAFRAPRVAPPPAQPLGRSATGVALGALLASMHGATSFQPLAFSALSPSRLAGAPVLALRGGEFGGAGAGGLVLNLSPVALLVRVPAALGVVRFDQRWGAPATLVSGDRALHHAAGDLPAGGVVAPGYSVTVLSR